MISAGCIRARHCSGAGGYHCPVGLATMDKSKTIVAYHDNLIKGIKSLLEIMGKKI